MVDALEAAGIMAFGPKKGAAQLEGSKSFMKDLCKERGIRIGSFSRFTDPAAAKDFIQQEGAPIVVKADGLAAGKGAVICRTEREAFDAVDKILVKRAFGDAGASIVVEEFLEGEEASYFALIDGHTVVPLASAQDHKAVGEGDAGENTGGMGAYSPAPIVTPAVEERVLREILRPTADAMVDRGVPFRGVLFAGLMIQGEKVDLLEFNVRFGDPECQALMMRLKSDLLDLMIKTCEGELSTVSSLEWSQDWAMTVVMASQGYPGPYQKGTLIGNVQDTSTAKIFHAGTGMSPEGNLISTGGRVLGVTSLGSTLSLAQAHAYQVQPPSPHQSRRSLRLWTELTGPKGSVGETLAGGSSQSQVENDDSSGSLHHSPNILEIVN